MMKSRMKHNKFHMLGIAFVIVILVLLMKGITTSKEEKPLKMADNNVIVVFKEAISDSDLQLLADKYKKTAEVVNHIGDYALFSVKEASDYNKVLNSLAVEPEVLSAESNHKIESLSFSNDPFSDTQWYIDNQGKYTNLSEVMKIEKLSTNDVDMDVVEAWNSMAEAGVTGNEVVVAIIDTGVDNTHPDLINNMWINKGEIPGDNIDNDNNGYVDDYYGWDFYNSDNTVCHYNNKNMASPEDNDNHGTHVAGIIAATANNNTGIAGIASNMNIKIMPLKINGGERGEGDTQSAIEAVKYAQMMGAKICNMSWGTGTYSAGLEKVMRESDMLFVAAAGNSGDDNDRKPMYPASYDLDNLISVTFINADGELTGYSDYGTKSVDLAAPGQDIYSTIVGSYDTMSGSSMAAPQVTAVAAMLYAYKDHLYASNVKEILTSNIKELPGLSKYIANGGIPSAYKAVMSANKLMQDKEAPVLSEGTEKVLCEVKENKSIANVENNQHLQCFFDIIIVSRIGGETHGRTTAEINFKSIYGHL